MARVIRLSDYFKPHPGQEEPYFGNYKHINLKWARRAGKGRVACFKMLDTYLKLSENPRPSHLVPQFHAMVVSPFTKNADQAWMDLLAYIPRNLIMDVKQQDRKIWLHPHGTIKSALIEFRSADNPAGLQGVGLDFLWTTESQDIPQQAYNLLIPFITSFEREGIHFAEGVPPIDPDHWFNALFLLGEQGEKGYYSSRLTYKDNPMQTVDGLREIELLRKTMTETEFRRMYEAADPEDTGFPMNIDRCLIPSVKWSAQKPKNGHNYVSGLDLGKSISATVLTVYDTSVTPWKLAYYRRMGTGLSWVVQKEVLIAATLIWRPDRVYMDAQGPGNPLYDELRFVGLPVRPVPIQGNTREVILDKLAVVMERHLLEIPREEQMIREHRAMRKVQTGPIQQRWQTPKGVMDDTVFSNALAVTGLNLRIGGLNRRKDAESYAVPLGVGI